MQVVQAIESYIVASLQFCQGVLHSYELLATMREQRDRFIANLLVDLMASHASKLAHEADLKSLVLVRRQHPRNDFLRPRSAAQRQSASAPSPLWSCAACRATCASSQALTPVLVTAAWRRCSNALAGSAAKHGACRCRATRAVSRSCWRAWTSTPSWSCAAARSTRRRTSCWWRAPSRAAARTSRAAGARATERTRRRRRAAATTMTSWPSSRSPSSGCRRAVRPRGPAAVAAFNLQGEG